MTDVIVVGAGPAGSAIARLLALRGIRVLLLDAASFPRRKPCGESLNPGAVAALERIGVAPEALLTSAAGPALQACAVRGWRLVSGRMRLEAAFPAGRFGLGCPRERLDELLVREAVRAGARFEDGSRVDGLLWDERGGAAGVYGRHAATGRPFRHRARLVVGADGLRSAAARSAGLGGRFGALRKAAFTARIGLAEELDAAVELHVRAGLVVGLAPLGSRTANLTVALDGASAAEAARDKPAFVLDAARRQPGLAARLDGAELAGDVLASGPFDRAVRAAAAPGLVLVGDAAGYYDPLTGQGIYRSVRSAELAAPRVAEALAGGGFEPLLRYHREREREFAQGLRLQRAIEWSSRRPAVWQSAMLGLRASGPFKSILAGWIGDC